jgi:hypothetical protein
MGDQDLSDPLANRRLAPVEMTTYKVKARLVAFKEEDDDIHLVIADPARPADRRAA